MKGRRLPDTVFGELPDFEGDYRPGDYWKYTRDDGSPMDVKEPTNLTGSAWGFYSPIGGIGTMMSHTVREEGDGTISVRPNDGSSNSILFNGSDGQSWHGYIEHGVWNHV
jgi:hypothetical protein